jgi:hypothetical protein
MSKLRIEFVRPLRAGDGAEMNSDQIMDIVAPTIWLAVTSTSAQSAAAPDFPTDRGLSGGVFARVTCVQGAAIVTEPAADPIATEAGGVRLAAGDDALLMPIAPGQKIAGIDAADGGVSYVASAAPGVASVTILSGGSLSGAVDLGEQRAHRLALPAGWTAAPITFQVSYDGVGFNDLYTPDGEYILASGVVGVSRSVTLDQAVFYGVRHLKIRSGTAVTPVNQAADRVINIPTVAR